MHEFTLTEIIIIIVISALHHESEALPYNVALCVRDCVCVCARCDVRTHHIESLKDFKDKVRLAAEENCMRIQRGVLDRFLHCAAEFLEAESIEFLVHLQPCEFELISTWHLARDKGVNRRQPLLACNVQKRNRSNTRIKEHTRSSHLISSRQSVSLSLSLSLRADPHSKCIHKTSLHRKRRHTRHTHHRPPRDIHRQPHGRTMSESAH